MKKIVKILLAVAIPVALVFLVLFIVRVTKVDAVRSPETKHAYQVIPGEEIEIGKKDVKVAETDGKILYVNPQDLNIILEDKATGIRFAAVDTKGTNTEKSLITVNYIGEDNSFGSWDSYQYCLQNYDSESEEKAYRLFQLESGVRIAMHISEGASTRFYEYMPQKMSVSNYNDVFIGGLDRLVAEGTLTEKEADRYKQSLKLAYKKSRETESYNVNFVGSPPKSAVTRLIALSQLVGYTTEMLLQDAEDFGFTVEFTEPAIFDIVLDIMLEGDELVVNMPVEEIVNGNDFFTLQNVELLTNFGLVRRENVEEGYMLIPDGSGALVRLNTFDAKVPDYVRGFYNNDYYTDYSYKPEYGQELMMPVFGMYTLTAPAEENGEKTDFVPYGFMGVVENGADTAYVETILSADGSANTGRDFNKIFTTYDVTQYEWVPVFGEYADNTSTFLSFAPMTQEDYTVRYFFFTGEEVSYYNMAKTYQNYLVDGNLPGVYQSGAQIFLETIGTLSLEERILGIPYDTLFSMTTYSELAAILDDLDGRHANISYKGVFDGGMNHKLMNGGKLVSTNGSSEELAALLAKVEGAQDSIFLETDFLKIYDKGNGFVKWLHGLEDYTKSVATIYGYRVEAGRFKQRSNMYNLLDPMYLVDAVTDFKAVAGNYNYYLNDLTEQYYADYGNGYVSPYEAQRLVDDAIATLAEGSKLALDNPRMDKLTGGTIAVDVSRESSDLTMFYTSIPFRQLVLNGIMEYTTTSANNNSDPAEYYLMQALETGAQPKFVISAKNVDVLKDSKYSYYFSIQYDLLKDEIKEVYDALNEGMEVIGTAQIVNHSMLAQDVFLTEYANGTKVVTNYTFDDVDYNGTTVKANDYLILKGGN
ncbi:MAG: hypothetical protein E7260_08615 [Lachnospiraceae bacterium]|nr:hypothetical protein [Lachnospiraceae bacterium]